MRATEFRTGASERKQLTVGTCGQACHPLGDQHPGFASRDAGSGAETLSADPTTPVELLERLRRAAFRSLSSEAAPHGEGCLYFGDQGVAIHAISRTFFLKDSQVSIFFSPALLLASRLRSTLLELTSETSETNQSL